VAEDPVYPPGVDVAVYEVICTVFPDTGAVNVTFASPLLYALFAPTFVAEAPVGASGAISGILGAYLVIFPRAKIQTAMMMGFFMRMIYIQARWFLPFWLVFQNLLPFFIGGFGVAGGGVAYLAHIGGFVVGLVTGYLYKKTHSSDFTYGTRYGYKA
jgi:membrane associated rhomboid family serine protease